MRTVATIYWDRYNGTHHTVISDVEDDGSHVVVNSSIHDNASKTLDAVCAFWAKELMESNVRAYTITEYMPHACMYAYVKE